MKLEDVLGPAVPLLFLAMMGIEALRPARKFPPVRHWRLVGVACVAMMGALGVVAPLLVAPEWLAAHRLIDLSGLGIAGGAAVGFLALSLVNYAYHRACHRFGLLWRLFHQIHHSATRVDMAGSSLFHPLDGLAYSITPLLVGTFVLGLDPRATALTGFIAVFYAFFQHWNVRTPRWLGVLIQRPESHCAHHQYGVHAFNYSDFPLWDMLFGSFRNPATWEGRAGFDAEASRRIGAMLVFEDVNPPQRQASVVGPQNA